MEEGDRDFEGEAEREGERGERFAKNDCGLCVAPSTSENKGEAEAPCMLEVHAADTSTRARRRMRSIGNPEVKGGFEGVAVL